MKDVFLHIKLMDQAMESDLPAILIQQQCGDGEIQVQGSALKLTFACNFLISWSAMSVVLDSFSICSKRPQIFEKKGFTLGVVLLVVRSGHEKLVKTRVDNALKFALKKPKNNAVNVKLSFGLCGCQEESFKGRELGEIGEDSGSGKEFENSNQKIQLQMPLPTSSFIVSVDEWQTIKSGGDQIAKWLLNADSVEFTEQIGPNYYKGVYMGKRVGIEKLKGCEKGNSYEFELHRDLLELMTCGHRNILQFCGICVDDNHGLCVVTKFMVRGSVHDLMLKNKKLQSKDIVRIAVDVAEGIKFMNDHGVAYRDLNTQRILLDRHGNACLGDMGVVTACKGVGEATEYETDGYRWLAPEVCFYSFTLFSC
jgi:serine/threonine protein kinase